MLTSALTSLTHNRMPIDAERLRIEQDLRGQLEGEVRCDDLFVQLYATDGSVYEVAPLGVVRPRTTEDVRATVVYANENGIPLHARGSGSGLAGESLGRGLVVDFSRFLKRIEIEDDNAVRVQAGVVLDSLNGRLAKRGRVLGPDPANSAVTTLGGMAGVDASGSRWHAYGSLREHVIAFEAILADGQLVRISRGAAPSRTAERMSDPIGFLANGVEKIVNRYQTEIQQYQEKTKSLVDRSGYRLSGLVNEAPNGVQVDLASLFVGSEGTLALITELELSTSQLPTHVGSMLFFFNSLDQSAQAAALLAEHTPLACDLMDRRHLSLAREQDPRYELLIPPVAEAVLLVEQMADSADALKESLRSVKDLLVGQQKLAVGCYTAVDQYDRQLLEELARRYIPTLYRLKGATRPVPFVEDIAVPPAALPEFLRHAQQTLQKHQVTASIFGHATHGQLHIRPFLDLANPADTAKMHPLAEDLYQHAWAAGGTISGEHGDGLSRTPFIARQHGPLVDAFREIKELFDPKGILNPGKKVALQTAKINENLRRVSYPLVERLATSKPSPQAARRELSPSVETVELQLDWQADDLIRTVRMCNGCGACRTQSETTRMCPIFHVSTREEASPRAKANLARSLLTGALPPETVLDDACKQIADLCVHCHMCRIECPVNVDVPRMMLEAKADYVATNGLRTVDWAMTRIDSLCKLASKTPLLSNWILGNRVTRWLLEKTLGVAQGRKLPYFQRRSFLQQAASRKLHRPQRSAGEKVLLFVDTYANYCDQQLANAMTAVLEHNGISVYIPREQREAGMPMISQGAIVPARRIAARNVSLLAEAVRQGYTIVSTEPSAVLAITHEYPILLADDDDAKLVAENTFEACHYLWRWHQRGKLQLDFQATSLTLGYHAPCHMKALEVGEPSTNLLNLIPGVRVRTIEKGCSGMAGLYGFKKQNYRRSLRVGLPLLNEMRNSKFQAGVTECSTCRIQMEQGSDKPTLHPVKVMALAYGLMPEFRDLLTRPGEQLRVK